MGSVGCGCCSAATIDVELSRNSPMPNRTNRICTSFLLERGMVISGYWVFGILDPWRPVQFSLHHVLSPLSTCFVRHRAGDRQIVPSWFVSARYLFHRCRKAVRDGTGSTGNLE